jgi:pimeloyl-ACP methyl ester carboxylesterase
MIVSHCKIVLAAATSVFFRRRTGCLMSTRSSNKAMMSKTLDEGVVLLADGTELPYAEQPSPLDIVLAHGLGSNPAEKSHHDDITTDLWNDALQFLPSSNNKPGRTAIFYTARGHGASVGWDNSAKAAETNGKASGDDDVLALLAKPFTWPELAKDTLAVAEQTSLANNKSSFTVFGQSMGAATALYLAMQEKNRVNALILARPPVVWKARRNSAAGYLAAAEALKEQNPGSYHWLPLAGAAYTDLPEKAEAYRAITVPVLILCHGQDENHPVLSGQQLANMMPQATLLLATNEEEARRKWPKKIAHWLMQQGLVEGDEKPYCQRE